MFRLRIWPGWRRPPMGRASGHQITAGRPAKRRYAPYGRHVVTCLVHSHVPRLGRNGASVNEFHARKHVEPHPAPSRPARVFIRPLAAGSSWGRGPPPAGFLPGGAFRQSPPRFPRREDARPDRHRRMPGSCRRRGRRRRMSWHRLPVRPAGRPRRHARRCRRRARFRHRRRSRAMRLPRRPWRFVASVPGPPFSRLANGMTSASGSVTSFVRSRAPLNAFSIRRAFIAKLPQSVIPCEAPASLSASYTDLQAWCGIWSSQPGSPAQDILRASSGWPETVMSRAESQRKPALERSASVPCHRLPGFPLKQSGMEPDVAVDRPPEAVRTGGARDPSGRMPGRAAGQFGLFQEHGVLAPALAAKIVREAAAHDAADDDDSGVAWRVWHGHGPGSSSWDAFADHTCAVMSSSAHCGHDRARSVRSGFGSEAHARKMRQSGSGCSGAHPKAGGPGSPSGRDIHASMSATSVKHDLRCADMHAA